MNDWSKADAAIEEVRLAREEFRQACREHTEATERVLAAFGARHDSERVALPPASPRPRELPSTGRATAIGDGRHAFL